MVKGLPTAELEPPDPTSAHLPLAGIRVVEIESELTGYAGKLLADLGAAVELVRLDRADRSDPEFNPQEFFLHHAKRLVTPTASIAALIRDADVILRGGGGGEVTPPELDPAAVRDANPSAIHAVVTPFGLTGPKATAPSTDLTRLAAGGLLWLGGYPDAEPVRTFGEQSTIGTGIYAAVAILLALLAREHTQAGETVEISAQEVVAQALETSISEYEMLGRVRRRLGDTPREAGTGIFRCADGYVSMVAGRLGTAAAWGRLVDWLQQAGAEGADELSRPGWDTLEHRQRAEAIAAFTETFERFAASWPKRELYAEGQRRGIAIAPVNTVNEVLADEQLEARGFFTEATDRSTGRTALLPVPPFRLSPPAPARTTEIAVEASLEKI
jgi:benzylsuccinate CoA-transferase BbsE subunit